MDFHGTACDIEIGAPQILRIFMEFHGIGRVIKIGALQVPWNSMELLVSAKLAHPKFHQNPWNSIKLLMSSWLTHSKFHGIPWNFMELLVSAKLAHSKLHGIPWNSTELLGSVNWAHTKLHGIPWNCWCQRNWRTPNSMKFHRNARFSEIGPHHIPRISMQLLVSAKLTHFKFHGIPCIWSCQRNWRTRNPRNSPEFNGITNVSDIGALQVPWKSILWFFSI